MIIRIVDDDARPGAELLNPIDNLRQVEIISDETDRRGWIAKRRVERAENLAPRFEPHPGIGIRSIGMRRRKDESLVVGCWQKIRHRPIIDIAIHESLRGNK